MFTKQPRHERPVRGRQPEGPRRREATEIGSLGRPVGSVEHVSMDGLRPPYLTGP